MKKHMLSIIVLGIILSNLAFAALPPTDVPKTHWAYESIMKILDSGLMEGYPDGSFRGQQAVDRYEMAVFVARLMDVLAQIQTDYELKITDTNEAVSEIEKTPPVVQSDNQMVKEVLSLVQELEAEFENDLLEINDRYYNIQLDYGKLEDALQNLESTQIGLSRRLDLHQVQIDSLNQKYTAVTSTREEVELLRKDIVNLNQELEDQSRTIRSLFIALGVMGAVVLLVGLN
ncbi:MAG: S-layer homology domain-containing protein [Firmicutes bacterium]|nr:S-layer homology domain-containing protein [Bacillota bacterium]MDD4693631.1 S-layer homology domain-containing protein [Bacillota bacterium]